MPFGNWQLLLAVAIATLLPIFCNVCAATQTSLTAEGQATEIHNSRGHKNIAHVYANHMEQKRQQLKQQQQQQQQQRQPTQQYYYDFHYKQNGSSGSGGNHNGLATPTATKSTEAKSEAEEAARKAAARRSYSGLSISVSGAGNKAGDVGDSEWRSSAHNHNAASGSSGGGGGGGNARSYNFGIAKLNGLTNLSGLRHISSGFGSSWGSTAAGGHEGSSSSSSGVSSGSSAPATTTASFTKHHIPIYEDQQENDYNPATLDASGAAGHSTSVENYQHGRSYIDYNSAGSTGRSNNDALTMALYNLNTAGTHNSFLPTYGGKFTSSPSSSSSASYGSDTHRFEHSSGGYDELPAAATYEHQPTASSGSAMQFFTPHDGFTSSSSHSGSDSSAVSSGSAAEADISFDSGHHGDGAEGVEDPSNYLSEQQHADGGGSGHSPPPDVINYIPYPVVKKVHVPVREPVQIPISHTILVPVGKPVPIHIPVTKHVPVPVEKELRVPVERVVPYPVEKPVAVPVEKRIPFEVVKYVTVKVPHPFPVRVPVFKTILHKVKKGGWW